MTTVHIRDDHTHHSACGATAAESISQAFYHTHVIVFDCCKDLWLRLCPECERRIAHTQPQGDTE